MNHTQGQHRRLVKALRIRKGSSVTSNWSARRGYTGSRDSPRTPRLHDPIIDCVFRRQCCST